MINISKMIFQKGKCHSLVFCNALHIRVHRNYFTFSYNRDVFFYFKLTNQGLIFNFYFLKSREWFYGLCFLHRFCVTGPLIHYFYEALDKIIPRQVSYSKAKRLLIDRGLFSPLFLLVFFYVVAILEVSLLSSLIFM